MEERCGIAESSAASLQVQLRLSFLRSLVFGMNVADSVVTVPI